MEGFLLISAFVIGFMFGNIYDLVANKISKTNKRLHSLYKEYEILEEEAKKLTATNNKPSPLTEGATKTNVKKGRVPRMKSPPPPPPKPPPSRTVRNNNPKTI